MNKSILTRRMRERAVVLGAAAALVLAAAFLLGAAPAPGVYATLETAPVPHAGDAADDAAIWRDPTDPARSTVIGTDKLGGVAVYGSQTGAQLQYLSGGRYNNVDLRSGFTLGGRSVSLVVASRQDTKALGIWRVDPATRKLVSVTAGVSTTLDNNYGLCLGRVGGQTYAYVNSEAESGQNPGEVEQIRLRDNGSGRVSGTKVRTFDVGTQTEGCVVDDANNALYIGEERVGIWRYSSLPNGGTARAKVDGVGSAGHLAADVEGLTIVSGHLLASSQGDSRFASYALPSGSYEGKFAVNANPQGSPDGVGGTDGIDATAASLGPKFPKGAFVAQDGTNTNPSTRQNFKLVPLEQVFPSTPPPPPDRDGDGVPDASDACPDAAGTGTDGCPAPPPPTGDADLDGIPDSRDVQGHGGYDDALAHEAMTELLGYEKWLGGAKGYIGEFGWPQNLENSRATYADEDEFNVLAETWMKRADKENLSVTVQETSERYANTKPGGYFASVYMQCGNLECPGFAAGNKPLALTKTGFQAKVVEAHPTTQDYFRGMNFSGGQRWEEGVHSAANPGVRDDNGDYHYPTTEAPANHDRMNSFEYLASRGVTHVRLGFRWERMQPTLGGPLDAEELAKYKQAVANANAAGLKVIADLHNYGGYWKNSEGGCDAGAAYDPTPATPGTGKLCLGSPELPKSAFVDVWRKLSSELKGKVFMYDLMNEPSGKKGIDRGAFATDGKAWESMTTGVVNGIRAGGDNTPILVPSFEAGIESTPEVHPQGPWIQGENLYWGAHQYLDHYVGDGTGGGKYSRSYAQENATSASKGF